ncbi:MAG: choice-of-anchor J domain-containing protein, partial [Bacteroidales bacterium]|nr:choice-of-anchor J domain-containing protein [Bacteroidales bacterium]
VILYCEDFEDNFVEERMPGWSFFDADEDGFNWDYFEDDDDGRYNHYSGIGFMSSASYDNPSFSALSPDNWAVTPAIQLSAVSNYLSFWVGAQDPSYAEEYYAVYITTDEQPSPDADGYTLLMREILGTTTPFETHDNYSNGVHRYAYRYVIKIPEEFDGETVHIAFRHYNCTDMYRINLDDVYVTETRPVVGDQESTPNPEPDPDPDPDPEDPNIVFIEDFEEDSPTLEDWIIWDRDEDGYNWGLSDAYAQSGEISLCSSSYYPGTALSPDNWAYSPVIQLDANSNYLSYWAMNYLTSYPDYYSLYIMEADAEDWEDMDNYELLFAELPSGSWTRQVIQIPAEYNGKEVRLVFRHHESVDQFRLYIDNIVITVADPASGSNPAPRHWTDAFKQVKRSPVATQSTDRTALPQDKVRPFPGMKK